MEWKRWRGRGERGGDGEGREKGVYKRRDSGWRKGREGVEEQVTDEGKDSLDRSTEGGEEKSGGGKH